MLWGIILIGLGQFLLCVGFTAGLDESLPLFVVAASVITAGYSLFAPVCWILQVSVKCKQGIAYDDSDLSGDFSCTVV